MKTVTKLGIFALALVVVLASSYLAGRIVGPAPATAEPAAAVAEEEGPGGLSVSAESMSLDVLTDTLQAGREQDFAFRILERDGTPLMRYKPQHDKLVHLIVARRDLAGFQHVHPNQGADGTWHVPLTLPTGGEYRVFVDFFPAWGRHPTTLGADVSVAGNYRPEPLPEPSRTATVDGYAVTLRGTLVPGESRRLTVSVSKDGRPVDDLEPYLAAFGHLVILRDGDLAYVHVHPDGAPGDGRTTPGPEVAFDTEVPSFGSYRLYLDFQHGAVVRTAEFTVAVGGSNPPPHGLSPAEFEKAKQDNLEGTGEHAGGATHGHGG